jgi:hypothetical protein
MACLDSTSHQHACCWSRAARNATQTLVCFAPFLSEPVSGGVIVRAGPALRSQRSLARCLPDRRSGELSALREPDPELVREDSEACRSGCAGSSIGCPIGVARSPSATAPRTRRPSSDSPVNSWRPSPRGACSSWPMQTGPASSRFRDVAARQSGQASCRGRPPTTAISNGVVSRRLGMG